MARVSRVVLPGVVHHVVARGVNKQRIFRSGYDKGRYLKRFARIAAEEQVEVHAYCLMNNHVHWILTPHTDQGLARLFSRMHTWWAMYFNEKQGRNGHLFQGRFHSSPMDEAHYWSAVRYVELNPKRAQLVDDPEQWPWSSARAHVSGSPDRFVALTSVVTRRCIGTALWREFLGETDPTLEFNLERSLRGSRLCGSKEWIGEWEQKLKRKLGWSPRKRSSHHERHVFAA